MCDTPWYTVRLDQNTIFYIFKHHAQLVQGFVQCLASIYLRTIAYSEYCVYVLRNSLLFPYYKYIINIFLKLN